MKKSIYVSLAKCILSSLILFETIINLDNLFKEFTISVHIHV